MTTSLKITTNGNYVATVKNEKGEELVSVGPGSTVEKSLYFPHGSGPQTYVVDERAATAEEVEAAKPKAE